MSDDKPQLELAAMIRQRQHTETPMTGRELLQHLDQYIAQGVDLDTLLEPPEVMRLWTDYLHVERFKVLNALRGESQHDYVSTACFHMRHAECRKRCKFCDEQCLCDCHD